MTSGASWLVRAVLGLGEAQYRRTRREQQPWPALFQWQRQGLGERQPASVKTGPVAVLADAGRALTRLFGPPLWNRSRGALAPYRTVP